MYKLSYLSPLRGIIQGKNMDWACTEDKTVTIVFIVSYFFKVCLITVLKLGLFFQDISCLETRFFR